MPVYLIHCIRSLVTYSVLTLTPVKMWFASEVCNKTVHLVTRAVLKKLNMSSSNSKQKIVSLLISWSMIILFCSGAVSLFIRQVWTGPHIAFFNFSFSLIRGIAQWHKHPTFLFCLFLQMWWSSNHSLLRLIEERWKELGRMSIVPLSMTDCLGPNQLH